MKLYFCQREIVFSNKQKPFKFMFEVNFIEVLNKLLDSKLYWKSDIDHIFTYKHIMIPFVINLPEFCRLNTLRILIFSVESCFIFLCYKCLGFRLKDYLEEVKLCLEKYV